MNLAYRELLYKLFNLGRCNDKQAIWLPPVTGNLCQKFIGCDTSGYRNPQLLFNSSADLLGNSRCAATAIGGISYVKKCFIQGQRLNQIGVFVKNMTYTKGRLPICIHPVRQDDQ